MDGLMTIVQIKEKADGVCAATTKAWLMAPHRSADMYAAEVAAEDLVGCVDTYLNELKLTAAKRQAEAK
jgi:hypothetical protein